MKIFILFFITALCEILGCYFPWLIVKMNKPMWFLIPSYIFLSLFAWLLTFHPTASGKTYAAYGGMYIFVAMLWLYFIDKQELTKYDCVGAVIALFGMFVIMFQPK